MSLAEFAPAGANRIENHDVICIGRFLPSQTPSGFFVSRAHLLTTNHSSAVVWPAATVRFLRCPVTRRIDKVQHTAYNTTNPARGHRVRHGERRAVHTKAVSHSLIKGVMRMRKERWRKLLRFLICFILVYMILMTMSPNVR